jgi:ABC-type transporter Mla MlaB component
VDICTRRPRASELTSASGALRITRAGDRLLVAGDIDEDTYPDLMAALGSIAGQPGAVHLHLAGVEYCDLAGLRAIVLLTETSGPEAGHGIRRVVLHGVPDRLTRLLRILGWDSAPGLVIAGPAPGGTAT